MNRREKILAGAVASIAGAALLYGLITRVVLAGGRELNERADSLKNSNAKLLSENNRMGQYKGRFVRLRSRTYDDNPRRASVLADAGIKQLARQAGLGQSDYTISSFSERREGNAYRLLLCTIRSSRPAPLERVTNFLYLLNRDRRLHRVTHLSILRQSGRPGRDRQGKVTFSLRYSTLVPDGNVPVQIAARTPATAPVELVSLNTPQRAAYDVIARRNIFKPYVRPPRQVRPRTWPPRRPDTQPAPESPAHERLVVTGLPADKGIAEVHIATPGRDIKKVLKVGDRLPIGEIVMVDYRVLTMPGDPPTESQSRVILKIGQDYWAVERGWPLGRRRLLRPEELPDELKPKPAEKTVATRPARDDIKVENLK